VHLVFTDTDGKQQDYSLAEAPPDFLQKLPPRLHAESKFPLLNPKIRFFDGLWLAKKDAVCKEVVAALKQTYPAGNKNEAYNAACRPLKVGLMSAYIAPKVPGYFVHYNNMGTEVIPAGGYPTGQVRQLQLEFNVPPVNLLRYTLTTPCTCHDEHNVLGVKTCSKDPDFTSLFDVSIVVRANSIELDSMKFGENPQMQSGYLVMQRALVLKDGKAIEKNVANLESTLERQLALDLASLATEEFSIGVVIYQFLDDLFKYGIGGLFEMSCNGQLFHNVSIDPTGGATYNSTTVQQMTKTVNQAFKTLFLALNSASAVGFTKLDIEEGPQKSLSFKLTYPAPAKPELENTAAAQNAPQKKGLHLSGIVGASIGTPTKQVKAGFPVMVLGKQFMDTYINAIDLSWNKTVAGIANTTVQWGPKGGQTPNSPPIIGVTKFHAPNLKPSTAYQFRVHECDRIACAPWSELLTVNTQAGGSNEVTIYLDNNMAEKIGTGTVLPNGSFNIKATIPANTAPGTHTITAATGVGPAQNIAELRGGSTPGTPVKPSATLKASSQITVIGQGTGAAGSATISIMKAGTAMTPPVPLGLRSTFRLRGAGFAPSVVVNLHLDSATGPKVGSATPNKLGIFAGNFELPATTSGNHEIVAVQVANERGVKSIARPIGGQTLQATVQVNVMPPIK
jgi:hypothetical protein